MSINLRSKSKLSIKIDPRTINPSYMDVYDCDTPIQIVYGGSSSGKSHAIARFTILWALKGRNILVARQVARTIRKSVFNELTKAISSLKLTKYFTINKTDLLIQSNMSDGCIMFVGCDDEEKIKSVTPPVANAFDLLWCEEATELSESTFNQLRLRMRGKSKFKKKTILTFNPIYESHWIYKRWFIDEFDIAEVLIIKTTYKDNNFLASEEIKVLEDMKEVSPYHYDVYCLGNFGVLGSRIFENWTEERFNIQDLDFKVYIGGDFGFTVDPAAVIFTMYDETNNKIYIFDEIYRKGLTNDKLAEAIKRKLELHGINSVIYFDSAEPKSIHELRDHGVNATKATKGPDSLLKGIDWLLQNTMTVHPNCTHTIEELKLYVRQEKHGEIQVTPVDKHNHLMDSLRYATCSIWHKSGKSKGYRTNLY